MAASQKSPNISQLRIDDVSDDMINEAVRIILILDHKKKPIKQSDIVSHMSVKPPRKLLKSLMARLSGDLENVGFKLIESPGVNNKSYLLIKDGVDPTGIHQFAALSERAERTLLFLVLTFIFMKDDAVSERELFEHLQQLQIFGGSEHEYFGDIKKIINVKFIEMGYLFKTAVANEEEMAQYQWGERAGAEVSKNDVLDFVCKVGYGGKYKPQQFVSQYQKANVEDTLQD